MGLIEISREDGRLLDEEVCGLICTVGEPFRAGMPSPPPKYYVQQYDYDACKSGNSAAQIPHHYLDLCVNPLQSFLFDILLAIF
jgi:hypothetical protein